MPQPTERDVLIVQEKLAELYATLSPSQQEVLDTLMAAGLSFVEFDDDTGGYLFSGSPVEAEAHVRSRMAELKADWQRVNPPADASGDAKERPELRWDLKPLLDWWQRPSAQPA
jgi:hypothetical protein